MATFRSDRERRMTGDRILSRKDAFTAIHPAVAEVHGVFARAHQDLQTAISARTKETKDAEDARETRDAAYKRVAGQLTWAYAEVERKLTPSWDALPDADLVDKARANLFPLGPPAVFGSTNQLTHDAMVTYLDRVNRVPPAERPPPAFMQAAQAALTEASKAAAAVNTEADEASTATRQHTGARARWDNVHVALKEVTSGFLRLAGKVDLFSTLFQDLPVNAAAGEYSTDPAPPPAGTTP